MVLLNLIVEPTATPVLDEAPQLTFALHVPQCAWVAGEPIGHNDPRVADVLALECLVEEVPGGLLVPLGAEEEVDGLAGAVDRPVEIASLPIDPDVCLIDVPRPAAGSQMAAEALLQLGGEALDPAGEGGVVDLHATVGQHLLEVAIADRELQVPAHGPKDDLS